MDLEKFEYDKGTLDELKRRAFCACGFLEHMNGWERRAQEIEKDVYECDDEEEVAKDLRLVCQTILKETSDDDDPERWNDLYSGLFGESLFTMGGYIPSEKEIVPIVRKCIQEKVRINTTIPEGCIA